MKRQLDELLYADLQKINHISENKHYAGFSKKFNKEVFVKIFKDPLKYNLEYEVLKEQGTLLLNLQEYNAFVLEYEDYIPLTRETMADDDIIKAAKLIAKFHKDNWLMIKNEKEVSLEKVLEKNVTRIADRREYEKVCEINSKLLKNIKVLEAEYEETLVLIHGDFGLRNIMRKDDRLVLIDFERVKYASYYLDFIKYFYQDLNNDKSKIELFLEHYYAYSFEKVISKELENSLVFIASLGILNYTKRVNDKEFESLGLRMLADVDDYFRNN